METQQRPINPAFSFYRGVLSTMGNAISWPRTLTTLMENVKQPGERKKETEKSIRQKRREKGKNSLFWRGRILKPINRMTLFPQVVAPFCMGMNVIPGMMGRKEPMTGAPPYDSCFYLTHDGLALFYWAS